MILFMIGFIVSLVPIIYAFHLRLLSTSGSFFLLAIATLILGFAGWPALAGLALLFIPPGIVLALKSEDVLMLESRSIISLSIIPLFVSVLYYFVPSEIWLIYIAITFSVSSVDIWRRITKEVFPSTSYRLFDFKRVVDTSGSVSVYGALSVFCATVVFAGYAFLLIPSATSVWLIGLSNGMMYFFLLMFGVLKRYFGKHKKTWLEKTGAIQIDEPMLRFLAAALTVIIITSILRLTL